MRKGTNLHRLAPFFASGCLDLDLDYIHILKINYGSLIP